MKTAFIGHRKIFAKDLDERLKTAIQAEIKNGCLSFTMGTHGEFDSLALNTCRRLQNIYNRLDIEVVITSLNTIKKDCVSGASLYDDVKTVIYDIETAHFKQKITLSNRSMLDGCDTLICYVDTSRHKSGAKTVLRYAKMRGLKIINLYRKEDEPFYGMTQEQIDEYWKTISDRL